MAAWAAMALSGCLPALPVLPLDRPAYPTGLAIAGDRLLVVSSDFDRAFVDGALLAADLEAVRVALAQAAPGEDVVVRDVYGDGAVVLPPFGERPVVTSGGERAYVPVRGSNAVVAVDVASDGSLSCGADGSPPRCTEGPRVLQLPETDPYDIVLLAEQRDGDGVLGRVEGAVALLASPRVRLFSDDGDPPGARTMRSEGAIELGAGIFGVRSLLLRPGVAGGDAVLIAGVDLDPAQRGSAGAGLVVALPEGGGETARLDITAEVGALSVRDMVLVSGADGDNDALVVVLRGAVASGPEAIARYEIDDNQRLPSLRLSALAPSCLGPTSLAVARLPRTTTPGAAGSEVLLLTCHDNDTVALIDPLTLRRLDVVRFVGRGPYDVVVHPLAEPPEAYVSFFSDNSIGVFRLVDEAGAPALTFLGRIGEAAPRREDGRE